MSAREKDTLDRLADGQLWVERLLELFWDVDAVMKEGRAIEIPAEIVLSYERAEQARKELS